MTTTCVFNKENVINAPEQGKKLVSVLSNEFCEEQAFSYRLPKDKLSYNAPRDVTISLARYFIQWLLNFKQYFVEDANCIFFARIVYGQHHLSSS